MSVAVHQVHRVVGADVDVVSVSGYAIAPLPGGQRVAGLIEDQHGRALPLEHVHPVVAIDSDAADAPKALSYRQPGPFRLVFVHVVAHPDGNRHFAASQPLTEVIV